MPELVHCSEGNLSLPRGTWRHYSFPDRQARLALTDGGEKHVLWGLSRRENPENCRQEAKSLSHRVRLIEGFLESRFLALTGARRIPPILSELTI